MTVTKPTTRGPVKITAAFLKTIVATGKRETYRDATVRGLVLRVSSDAENRTWYLDYRDKSRKRVLFKIGPVSAYDPTAAKVEARRLLGEIAKGKDPAAIRRAEKAAAVQAEQDAALSSTRTLGAFLDGAYKTEHLAHQRTGERTRKRIAATYRAFLDTDLAAITADALRTHQSKRLADGVTPQTVNRDRGALSALLAAARDRGLIAASPFTGLPRAREPHEASENVRWLGQHDEHEKHAHGERERFLAALGDAEPELQALVRTAYFTGCRRGELFALRWADVSLKRRELTVRAASAKSGRSRIIPLPDPAVAALKEWRRWLKVERFDGHVFIDPRTGAPLHEVRSTWGRLCRVAKLERFRFHDLRHDYASRLVQAGVPLERVQKLLGHSSLAMTQRYSHLSAENLRDAVDRLG